MHARRSSDAAGRRKVITVEYLDETTDINRENFLYYIGIDPSYSATGIVVLDTTHNTEPLRAFTVKAGSSTEKFAERVQKVLDKLEELLLEYPVGSTYVVMEGAAFASEFGAFKLGKLSGVIEYFLHKSGLTYNLVAPTFLKKVACGNGAASKPQVMAGVRKRWGFQSLSNDINDAYTLAQIAKGALPLPPPPKPVKRKPRKKADLVATETSQNFDLF